MPGVRSSISLPDLLAAGLLHPGQRLVFRKRGPSAEVTSSGTIRLSGKEYTSPSTAGMAAAGGTSTNGWVAWYAEDGDDLTLLSELRLRLATDLASRGKGV